MLTNVHTAAMMTSGSARDPIEAIRLVGKELGFWRNGHGYRHSCRQLFGDTDFAGKTMLEIGCGKGLYCFWAKIQGAAEVVGIEPLLEGAYDSAQCFDDFNTIKRQIGLTGIEILPKTIQDYTAPANYFDIVLSVASINHLDEPSCVELRRSHLARESYLEIFRHIRSMMKFGGKLIIMDASHRNVFADLGMKNPITPNIEWHKHHAPEVWIELLEQAGFSRPQVRWFSGPYFRRFARVYYIPRALSYFWSSVFKLEMVAS